MAILRGLVPDTTATPTVLQISAWRRLKDMMATAFAVSTVVIVLTPLVAIFGYLVYKGIGSVNLAFLTQIPKPPGEVGGGMANAIGGSILILAIASLLGVPLGIGAGIYLAEYGRNRFGDTIRFVSDVLNGVPSIVIGIVAYAIVVLRQKHFSALAGGVAGLAQHVLRRLDIAEPADRLVNYYRSNPRLGRRLIELIMHPP